MAFLHRHRWLTPYLLLAPGIGFLVLFFVVPLYYLANTSLQEDVGTFDFVFTWAWDNYSDSIRQFHEQFLRSLEYAGIATGLTLAISYPLAYWIATRGGRWKNLLLLFIIAPFFVTYLIRTLAWLTILSDDGRLLATSTAVVAGITYNYLPFMALPLYVSIEQIDRRLIEAAQDLYASRAKAFIRVTLPLSLPGVFAGSLLTFIPAVGDFINAQLLGTPRQFMIGNVIQSRFLALGEYGEAAALSIVVMGAVLVLILIYARVLGTERLTG